MVNVDDRHSQGEMPRLEMCVGDPDRLRQPRVAALTRRLRRAAWVAALSGCILAIVLAAVGTGHADTTTWTVSNYTILVNGKPFFAKGVGYYPLPLGNESSKPPYGDYFYNFQDDNLNDLPPVWKPYLDRDLPTMRAAGINVIRLYSMWAWADANYVVAPLNGNKTRTLRHQSFLDTAYNGGVQPMYVLVNVFIEAGRWADPVYQRQIEDVYRQLATDLGNHPGVMGFMVGNELNSETNRENPAFWQWLDSLAGMIKQIAPGKLTTMALVDDGFVSIDGANQHAPTSGGVVMPHLDVWGINNYRGSVSTGFTSEFWTTYPQKATKPLLLTEWGSPASTHVPDAPYPAGVPQELPNRAESQATYIANHYNDMVDHSTLNKGISSGGALFLWADQWDKQECATCSPLTQDGTTGIGGFPGKWWDEEWFGIHSLIRDPSRPPSENWNTAANQPYPPDTLVPRAGYDTIQGLFTKPDPEVHVTRTSQAQAGARVGAAQDAGEPNVYRISLSLLANHGDGQIADWYVGALVLPEDGSGAFTVFQFLPDGRWDRVEHSHLTPVHTGPVVQFHSVDIYHGPIGPGHYVIYFALDIHGSDGTGSDLHVDYGTLTVTAD